MWLFFHSVASSYIVFIQVSHKTTRSSSPCSLKAHEHKSKHTGFQRNGPNLDMECKRHTLRILKEELRILLLRIYIYVSIQYALVWELFLVPILMLPVHVTFSAFRCREWTDLWLIFGPKAGDQMS